MASTLNVQSPDNTLSEKEKEEGWQLLFDGNSLNGWRPYKNNPLGKWIVEQGTLHCLGNKTGTESKPCNLITDQQFENFEFTIDWVLSPAGNSGIMYMVTEQYEEPYLSGPEYQLLDDKWYMEEGNYSGKLELSQMTGANYAMNAPHTLATNPIGEWNNTHIIVNRGHVEHWLNGVKVVGYDLWTVEWKENKANGKWKDEEGYGMSKIGHICLQDHYSEVWFKNIKIKIL